MRLRNLLSKLKWDPEEDLANATISYLDRTSNGKGTTIRRLIDVKGEDVVEVTGGYTVIRKGSEKSSIPLHRVRVVRDSQNKVRWSHEGS